MKILLKLSIILLITLTSFIGFCYYKYSTVQPYVLTLKPDIRPNSIKEYDGTTGKYKAFSAYNGPNQYMFSVIIPVHNVEAYLEKCLESVLVQYYKNYEIIMIENNSTDGSLKIAERYARAHKNIRLIVQDGGKMGGARNTGIRAASGKYITFLDSDDYFNYGALKDAASTLSTNHVDLLMYNFDKVHFSTGQKLSYKETSFGYDEVLNSKSYSPFDAIGKIGMVTVSRMIYKRDLLIKNQLFFRSNMNHEDVLYFIKMFSHDLSFYTRNKSFFSYRVMRPNSVMSTGGHVSDVFTLVDVLRKDFRSRNLLKQHNVDLLNLENKLLKGAFRGLSIEESMSLLRYMKERYNSEEHLEKYGDADLTSMRYYAQYSALKKGGFWYWLRKIGPNQLEFEVKRFAFGLL